MVGRLPYLTCAHCSSPRALRKGMHSICSVLTFHPISPKSREHVVIFVPGLFAPAVQSLSLDFPISTVSLVHGVEYSF